MGRMILLTTAKYKPAGTADTAPRIDGQHILQDREVRREKLGRNKKKTRVTWKFIIWGKKGPEARM